MRSKTRAQLLCFRLHTFSLPETSPLFKCTSTRRTSGHCLGTFKSLSSRLLCLPPGSHWFLAWLILRRWKRHVPLTCRLALRYTPEDRTHCKYCCENLKSNKFSSCLTENLLSSLFKDKLVNVKVDIRCILRDSLHWYNTEFNVNVKARGTRK
jgi:hypothetical protein